MSEGKSPIDRFDGTDYGFWRMQIEDYLYGKELHAPLLGSKPADMKDEDWTLLDRKALSVIRLSLSRNVAFHTAKAKSTCEALKILSNLYEKPSASNKVHLMRRLFNLKMVESATVAAHLNEFNTITTQLSSVEIEFDDEVKALILLSSLPESWDAVVTAVSASCGKEKLKLDSVRDLVLSEEIRRKQTGTPSGSALNTEIRGRSDSRGRNRGRSKSRNRNQGKKDYSRVVCWNCDKSGHFQNQCKAPKKEKKEKKSQESANVAEEIHDSLMLSVSSPSDEWVVDSGASFHSCSSSEFMESYTPSSQGVVYLADNTPMKIAGKGDVMIRSTNGTVWKLRGVRHIPGLKRNLISVGQLDDEGYTSTFGEGRWKISKGVMTLARGLKSGTLYMSSNSCGSISLAGDTVNAKQWHDRLGHMSEKGMKVLSTRGLLPGLDSVDVGMCEDCILGKQKRVSFSTTGRELKKEKLELVHSDLWGPAPVNSVGGASYYMTFIDDATRKVWVYFLKRKSDAFDAFKTWKALVENQTGIRVKCLRSDNGGEYEDAGFKKFCAENGIRMEKTIPGTPQQNGVAERMNRTLNERARCMRLKCGLPQMFWADAINTAAFLINRGPSIPLQNGIPEEAWTGKEVNLSFLRTFGCAAFVMTDDRNKLEAKSVKCTFIGYGNDEFGYRFWDEKNRKVLRSRNVVFDETRLYKDGLGVAGTQKSSEPVEIDISTGKVDRTVPDSPEPSTGAASPTSPAGRETQGPEIAESQAVDIPLALRKAPRQIRPPTRYLSTLHYMLLTDCGEPECYAETQKSEDRSKWELAMDDEMKSLQSNETWDLCELPKGKKVLHNKWVFRIKQEADGSKRYKARLVAKGFQQKYGIDYTDVFTPVVKMTTIRLVLSMVAAENLELHQLDVKTAFLHGDLEEEIYMEQPEGYTAKGDEGLVCRLKKSLYGLKQAPRQWYKKFDGYMFEIGFTRCMPITAAMLRGL